MLTKFFGFIRDVFDFAQKLQRTIDTVNTMQRQTKEMSEALNYLANENQRLREYIELKLQNEASERENQKLQLENEMLKFERRLTPPPTPTDAGHRNQ